MNMLEAHKAGEDMAVEDMEVGHMVVEDMDKEVALVVAEDFEADLALVEEHLAVLGIADLEVVVDMVVEDKDMAVVDIAAANMGVQRYL